jgi:hypothetical protein
MEGRWSVGRHRRRERGRNNSGGKKNNEVKNVIEFSTVKILRSRNSSNKQQ